MKVHLREVQAQAAGDEDHHTQKEPDHKTDQIKIRPGHSRAPFLPLPVAGCNASSSLSASPGVSRIAPISRKLFRVSLSRANLVRTSLTSLSLAKRSEACSSHTSSFPSTVRKSDVNSVW